MLIGNNHKKIKKALETIKKVVEGDFEARIMNIQARGDLGELLYAINDLIDRSDAYIRESQAAMDAVSHNKYYKKLWKQACRGLTLMHQKPLTTRFLQCKQR